MRFSPALIALPALASAQQQIPLVDQVKGWFAKATDAASSFASSVPTPSIVNPVDVAASSISDAATEKLTLENYQKILRPGAATASPGIEEWMVFITGGNKTCFGLCEHSEKEWNRSVPLLQASKNAPNLAYLDCESEPVLCNAWAAGPPTVLHLLLPQPLPDQSTPATTARFIPLNRTSVSSAEIVGLHTQAKYKDTEPYEGVWHPFDGQLVKFGLNVPIAYAIWGFSKVPSWAFMIGISFLSRTIM